VRDDDMYHGVIVAAFDNFDQPLGEYHRPAIASVVSYTANALNQYSAVGVVTPTWDGNGNLTSDGTFTLGYDAENRLISVSGAGDTASYSYDGQGRPAPRAPPWPSVRLAVRPLSAFYYVRPRWGADLPMLNNDQPQSGVTPDQQAILHGNSLDSQRQTYVYQLTEVTTGDVLKYGITSAPNPTSRYPATFYADTNSRMDVIATYSNRDFARAHEIIASGLYLINNGQLPPLSSVP
jgi:hypothetical protein